MNAVIGTFLIAVSFAAPGFVLNNLCSIVTGSGGGGTSASYSGGGGDEGRIGTEGGTPTCCYSAESNCEAACTATPSTFNVTGGTVAASCRTVCADSARRYLCRNRPAGTTTCTVPDADSGRMFGTAVDACTRFRCGTPPGGAICTPPVCPMSDCPTGVRSLDDLVRLWATSLPSTPGAADTCRRCITEQIASPTVQAAYAGLDGTCIAALSNVWRTTCTSQCARSP